MVAGFGLVFLGIAALYLVTTFVMILDIRDNTRRMVELLEERPDGPARDPAGGGESET